MKHPGIELGAWLKARRRRAGMIARVFAGEIRLAPAEYTELEAGVVRWIGAEQETLIPQVLALDAAEHRDFKQRLATARAASPLQFADLFTPEQLEPVRLRRAGRGRLTPADKKAILEAVFRPLA